MGDNFYPICFQEVKEVTCKKDTQQRCLINIHCSFTVHKSLNPGVIFNAFLFLAPGTWPINETHSITLLCGTGFLPCGLWIHQLSSYYLGLVLLDQFPWFSILPILLCPEVSVVGLHIVSLLRDAWLRFLTGYIKLRYHPTFKFLSKHLLPFDS